MSFQDERMRKYCVGCGLCKSCGISELETDENGFQSPKNFSDSRLKMLCPTSTVPYSTMDKNNIWGKSLQVYRGWAIDRKIRKIASSGGIISAIAIYLLESNKVDEIIHIRADRNNPTINEVTYSKNREEVLSASGSRYSISHPLEAITLIDKSKKYAFIGKPCDVIALKNYYKIDPEMEETICYTLSFFCMGEPSVKAQKELLNKLDSNISDCVKLSYRGNGWPGYTTLEHRNGSKSYMDYNSSWGEILGRDLMPACRFCIDGIGESADISCGDAWYIKDGHPDFSEHEGRNIIFARTQKGLDILDCCRRNNIIHLESYPNYKEELSMIQRSQFERRALLKSRLLALKIMNKPFPNYDLEWLSNYAHNISLKKSIKSFFGTCKRILEGKI